MAASDELLQKFIESLAAEGIRRVGRYGTDEFELDVGELLGRLRAARDRDLEDVEIAQLIPRGVDVVIERKGGSRRNNFRRASRGREILRTSATLPIWGGTKP